MLHPIYEELYTILGTNVYAISVRQKDFDKLAKSLLEDREKDLSSIPAVRHGILNEEACRRRYVSEQSASEFFFAENCFIYNIL